MICSYRYQKAMKTIKGNKTNYVLPITPEQEQMLWDKGIFGLSNPTQLLKATYFYVNKCFGNVGQSTAAHRSLKREQFQFKQNEYGKYVELTTADQTTCRQYQDPNNENCAYNIIHKYCQFVPGSGVFYRQPLEGTSSNPIRFRISSWYPGINNIQKFVKDLMSKLGEKDGHYTGMSIKIYSELRLQDAKTKVSRMIGVTKETTEVEFSKALDPPAPSSKINSTTSPGEPTTTLHDDDIDDESNKRQVAMDTEQSEMDCIYLSSDSVSASCSARYQSQSISQASSSDTPDAKCESSATISTTTDFQAVVNKKNTVKATRWATNVWDFWAAARNKVSQRGTLDSRMIIPYASKLDTVSREDLGQMLVFFIQEVHRADGRPYPPDSLRDLSSGLQRHIRDTLGRKDIVLLQSTALNPSNAVVIQGYQRALNLRCQELINKGIGATKQNSEPITNEQERLLWNKGVFGLQNAKQLQRATYFYLNKCFSNIRTQDDHRNLMIEQLQFKEDEYGKYVQLTANDKVCRQYQDPNNENCAFNIIHKYCQSIPKEGAFYRKPIQGIPVQPIRYSSAPLGSATIKNFVKDMMILIGEDGNYGSKSIKISRDNILHGICEGHKHKRWIVSMNAHAQSSPSVQKMLSRRLDPPVSHTSITSTTPASSDHRCPSNSTTHASTGAVIPLAKDGKKKRQSGDDDIPSKKQKLSHIPGDSVVVKEEVIKTCGSENSDHYRGGSGDVEIHDDRDEDEEDTDNNTDDDATGSIRMSVDDQKNDTISPPVDDHIDIGCDNRVRSNDGASCASSSMFSDDEKLRGHPVPGIPLVKTEDAYTDTDIDSLHDDEEAEDDGAKLSNIDEDEETSSSWISSLKSEDAEDTDNDDTKTIGAPSYGGVEYVTDSSTTNGALSHLESMITRLASEDDDQPPARRRFSSSQANVLPQMDYLNLDSDSELSEMCKTPSASTTLEMSTASHSHTNPGTTAASISIAPPKFTPQFNVNFLSQEQYRKECDKPQLIMPQHHQYNVHLDLKPTLGGQGQTTITSDLYTTHTDHKLIPKIVPPQRVVAPQNPGESSSASANAGHQKQNIYRVNLHDLIPTNSSGDVGFIEDLALIVEKTDDGAFKINLRMNIDNTDVETGN